MEESVCWEKDAAADFHPIRSLMISPASAFSIYTSCISILLSQGKSSVCCLGSFVTERESEISLAGVQKDCHYEIGHVPFTF